ncbi:hypothetical protein HU200_006665 [Digitaria exilis]|uniref:Uncharacterized protein n=1 Tax=Digitaria exilis TaxID=1010633 RepID=A0A835FQC7_9POAL|nr:hypothetical protein HU200_006665 [Digitaria exilis]
MVLAPLGLRSESFPPPSVIRNKMDVQNDALLRPAQGIIARGSLHSVFSIEVNLRHLVPGGNRNVEAKRKYYRRTHKVDPALPEITPEEEEELAAEAERKGKQSKTTRNTTRKATRKTKKPEDQEWRRIIEQAQDPTNKEGDEPYSLRKRQRNNALTDMLQGEAEEEEAAKTRRKTERAKREPSNEDSEEASRKNGIKTSHRDGGQRNATGFAIAEHGNTLRILTCAHTIDEVYTAGHHDISVDEVNEFFTFDVHCSHQEVGILNELNGRPINEQVRMKTRASVVAIDSERDLMVLEINKSNIHLVGEQIMCDNPHPRINIAEDDPTELDVCILQGWPAQRMGSLSVGQLSLRRRTYEAITQINEKGYTMKLAEFTKMRGEEGSSGGPALDGLTRCVGVYHGVIGTKEYVVCADDVNVFLNRTGMVRF